MDSTRRLFALSLGLIACMPEPSAPPEYLTEKDAGASAQDAGAVDAGQGNDAGLASTAPVDTVFSFGMIDNSSGAPQGAPYVNLVFSGGVPSSNTVVAARVATAPTLDGLATDWANIAPSVIPLQLRGEPIGMTKSEWDYEYGLLGGTPPIFDFGFTNAIVRAAYDDDHVYFLFEWSDATESRNKDRLTFIDGAWVRNTENEDRLYMAFNANDSFPGFAVVGCSAACHVKERLGDVTSEGRAYRFRMHTNAPGEIADVWSWRSVTTDPLGLADDMYWNESRRQGDSATEMAISNRRTVDGGTEPVFMSADGVNASPDALFHADAGVNPLAVPYDPTGLAEGASMPGYVYQRPAPNRDDVRAVGQWRNGKWTVEVSRARVTTDPNDVQFK
jgi:hypothetical protein